MTKLVLWGSLLFSTVASAAVITIDASSRGWVCSGVCDANNGSYSLNNYLAGNTTEGIGSSDFRNWFEFVIPNIPAGQTLQSAELVLDAGLHLGGNLTYSVYGLEAIPLAFSDVSATALLGSTITNGSVVGYEDLTITLNSAALSALVSSLGGSFFLGGINSGEDLTNAYDFGGTTFIPSVREPYLTQLVLTTSEVPEPSSFAPVLALLGIGMLYRSKTTLKL